jgi:hypothetical protein
VAGGRRVTRIDRDQARNTAAEYGIRSRNIRFRPGQSGQAKGYKASDFYDAWERYCPLPAASEQGEPSQPSRPGQPWYGSTRGTTQPVPAVSSGTAQPVPVHNPSQG